MARKTEQTWIRTAIAVCCLLFCFVAKAEEEVEARGLKQTGQDLDEGEFLNVEKIPFRELLSMAEEGQISDSKTQLCIYKAARRLGI